MQKDRACTVFDFELDFDSSGGSFLFRRIKRPCISWFPRVAITERIHCNVLPRPRCNVIPMALSIC